MDVEYWLANGNGIGKALLVSSMGPSRWKIDESSMGINPPPVPCRGYRHLITESLAEAIFDNRGNSLHAKNI